MGIFIIIQQPLEFHLNRPDGRLPLYLCNATVKVSYQLKQSAIPCNQNEP